MTSKKVIWLALAAFALIFCSCETQPDVPLVATSFVPTTTTTTVRAPVMIVSQAPTPTTTTVAPPPKPILPSISEPEYRNLFASVNDTFKEILFHEIDKLLLETFAKASEQFQSARMSYETQIWRWPYDGEAAYTFAGDLRNSGKSLSAILNKGLPLRSEAEEAKARALAGNTCPTRIPSAAFERLGEAKDEYAAGKGFHAAAQYRSSIASFRKAILLYRSADTRDEAENLRSMVMAAGYGRYSSYHMDEANRWLQEDASLYAGSDNDAITRGIELLEKAKRSYENILAWGAEREAMEAKDKALIARQSADWLHAELNAAEEYSNAATRLAEAETHRESRHFNEATALYDEAAIAFEIARLTAANLECAARTALEMASQAAKNQKTKLKMLELRGDENLLEAESLVASADDKLAMANFADSRQDSLEALNQVARSESRYQALLSAQETARMAAKQSEADRLTAEENAGEEAELLAMEARLRAAEALATAQAAELAAKSAELEALRAAYAQSEAEMRAKAESDAAEKAELERKAAEAQAHALSAAQAAAEAEAARIAAESLARQKALEEAALREAAAAAAQAEADRLAAERAASTAEATRLAEEQAAMQTARDIAAIEAALRVEASQAIDEAKRHYEWAVSKNARNNYPEALAAGGEAIEAANAALASGDTEAAKARAQSALSILSGIKEYAELPAAYIVDLLPERKDIDSLTSIAGAEYGYNDSWKWTILYEANKSILKDPSNPHLLISGQIIVIPSIRGEMRSGTWDPKKTYSPFDRGPGSETEILDAIDQAKKAYDRAVERNARNNYPALFAEAARDIEASRKAYDSGDSLTASAKAAKTRAILESIPEFAPLPASYRIGMVPERRDTDSLWTIAASPFGYNDPHKWTILYKANKATLPDPSNPDLLRSGQVILIPSISGERREGLWDPKKTYPGFGKR